MLCDARASTSGGAGEGPNADPGLSPVVERNVPHGEVFLEEAFANNYGFTAMNAGSSVSISYNRRHPARRDLRVRDLTTIARQSAHGNRCAVR